MISLLLRVVHAAVTLGFWVTGHIGPADFFALSAAQLAGALLSGLATYLTYYPHFQVRVGLRS